MSRRPEILFPLFADLKGLDGVGPRTAEHFAKMDVEKPRDLLFTLPHNIIDRKIISSIKQADLPSVVTVEVEVGLHQPNAIKGRPYRVMVEDAQASFQLVFFHAREDWLRKQLPAGQRRVISGNWKCSTVWRKWCIPITFCVWMRWIRYLKWNRFIR